MNKKNNFFLLFPCLLVWQVSMAQQQYLLLQNDYERPLVKVLDAQGVEFHSSIRPYLASQVNQLISLDSLDNQRDLFNKLKDKEKKEGDVKLSISPLLSFVPGREKTDTSAFFTFDRRIGGQFDGNFKNKLHVNLNYQQGNSIFPGYVSSRIEESDVIPNTGYNFGNDNNLYRIWGGYLSYSSNNVFNITLGRGKNFWGNGYRSLLLSDASTNYNYLRITTTVGKFKYVNLWANFKDIGTWVNPHNYWDYPNKFGAFHYLSWNPVPWLNLAFFETVIWPGKDNQLNRGLDLNYLNPVIFYRPVEFSTGSSDNSLGGFNGLLKIGSKHRVYGQVMLDEFLLSAVRDNFKYKWLGDQSVTQWGWWANKQAFQFGYKWYDAFFIKNANLRLEYNLIPPYTYAHTGGLLNYGHFNESLAHNSGANLKELIAIVDYQRKSWYTELKTMYLTKGFDNDTSNYGGDIYKHYLDHEQPYQNFIGQGIQTNILLTQLKVGYMIHPQTNLRIELGIRSRREESQIGNNNSRFIFVGISTSLSNIYHDF